MTTRTKTTTNPHHDQLKERIMRNEIATEGKELHRAHCLKNGVKPEWSERVAGFWIRKAMGAQYRKKKTGGSSPALAGRGIAPGR
jgi:hypothetical protein